MILMGLYDNEDLMNNLGARRAIMHGTVMVDCLWEITRAKREQVGVGVLGMTLFIGDSFTRVIVWNHQGLNLFHRSSDLPMNIPQL